MANNLEKTVRAYIHGSNISKRYIRVEEATGWLSEEYTNIYTKDDKDIGENSYTDIEYAPTTMGGYFRAEVNHDMPQLAKAR